MTYVAFSLECSINDRDALDAIINDLTVATRAHEPGTDIYEWSVFEDGSALITYERFADLDAALAHHVGFGPYAERFLATVTLKRFVVFGTPGDALKEALAGASPVYVTQINGFRRHQGECSGGAP